MGLSKSRELDLSGGIPKIGLSIMEKCEEDILERAKELSLYKPDFIEWRLDYYSEYRDFASVRKLSGQIRDCLDIPLLLTMRSVKEGGMAEITSEDYRDYIREELSDGIYDLLDVEVYSKSLDGPDEEILSLIDKVKDRTTLMSCHLDRGPESLDEVVKRLKEMNSWPGDIVKLVYKVDSEEECRRIICASALHKEEGKVLPFALIGMGKKGSMSRICGEVTGQSFTFATVETSSDIGQVEIGRLRDILYGIHNELQKED